jgi:hypothetical protein
VSPNHVLVVVPLSGNNNVSKMKRKTSAMDISKSLASTIANEIHCQQGQQHHALPEASWPPPLSPPRPRINMTLRRGHLTQNLYNTIFTCDSLFLNKTRHMHPVMKSTPGVLDFTTFLSTDLKILVMGDSVAMQISQTIEEMLGAKLENRQVYRYIRGSGDNDTLRESLHVSAPIRGGGVVAGWRLLGMLLHDNLNKHLPNFGPGWRMQDVYKILHHTYNTSSNLHTYNTSHKSKDYIYRNGGKQQELVENTRRQQKVDSFDVLLFHIPIGWIKDKNSINNITLMETVILAGQLFGVETVVFNVPSFTNNIVTAQQLKSLIQVQYRIVQFSQDFVPSKEETTVQHVLTLRMDRLMDETMEWNARLMGMIPNISTTTTRTPTNRAAAAAAAINSTTTIDDENDWRLVSVQPLNRRMTYIHTNHVAQTCSALPRPETPNKCPPNYFSRDGMHVCMETMGGRLFAGLGCVLGCVYNNNDNSSSASLSEKCQQQQSSKSSEERFGHHENVLNCVNACNDLYLSLTSVDNEVLD